VNSATILVACLSFLSAPVLGIAGAIAFFSGKPKWQVPATTPDTIPTSYGPWLLAVASLLIWLPILPRTQGEQQLRSRVEDDLMAGRIAQALDSMSAQTESDFPPHWSPPPSVGNQQKSPDLLDVMDVIVARDCAPWVQALYLNKFKYYLGGPDEIYFIRHRGTELARVVRILQSLPEGPAIATLYQRLDTEPFDGRRPPEDQEHLKALADLAAKGKQKPEPKKDTP
jgi:hypothetical protein